MERKLTEEISYIPAIEEPLSSDVIIIRGAGCTYIYDVGNSDDVTEYLNSLSGKKCVILSHFHEDHTGGLSHVFYDTLYVGNQTKKSLGIGEVITSTLTINDGVKIDIIPCPSSHAKGCLLVMVNNTWLFVGDSLYSSYKDNNMIHNVSILKEEIDKLKSLPASKYYLDHRKGKFVSKDLNILLLERIYAKRQPGEPYIHISY